MPQHSLLAQFRDAQKKKALAARNLRAYEANQQPVIRGGVGGRPQPKTMSAINAVEMRTQLNKAVAAKDAASLRTLQDTANRWLATEKKEDRTEVENILTTAKAMAKKYGSG